MRGLRIIRGYVQIRIYHNGKCYQKNFGPDSTLARQLGEIHLSEKRKEILMGRFGLTPELPVKSFTEAAHLYFDMWSKERTPEGAIAHGAAAEAGRVIENNLIPYFGKMLFNDIKPKDVIRWRQFRLKSVMGTSVNREQAVLSSIFSHMVDWVQNETLPAFRLPEDTQTGKVSNPCLSVERAPNRKRERVLTTTELRALKAACHELKDLDLWEICEMALKSLLRKKDLFNLESGLGIDMIQAKTGRAITLPVSVGRPLNYANFRKRWLAARRGARLDDCQFRDLRKTGANILKLNNHSTQLISEFLGHADPKTTKTYMVRNVDHLIPLAKDLNDILGSL